MTIFGRFTIVFRVFLTILKCFIFQKNLKNGDILGVFCKIEYLGNVGS